MRINPCNRPPCTGSYVPCVDNALIPHVVWECTQCGRPREPLPVAAGQERLTEHRVREYVREAS